MQSAIMQLCQVSALNKSFSLRKPRTRQKVRKYHGRAQAALRKASPQTDPLGRVPSSLSRAQMSAPPEGKYLTAGSVRALPARAPGVPPAASSTPAATLPARAGGGRTGLVRGTQASRAALAPSSPAKRRPPRGLQVGPWPEPGIFMLELLQGSCKNEAALSMWGCYRNRRN